MIVTSNSGGIFLLGIRNLNGPGLIRVLLAAVLLFFAGPLLAQGSAGGAEQSVARLFQARSTDGLWTAGLEITLAPGWKTYWRIPGDSGVPPQFDWSKSSNLKAVTIGWPAPRRYRDAAGETIGYKDSVVLPMQIEPLNEAEPANVELQLFYAVCKDICIPAEVGLRLEFLPRAAENPADRLLLDRFAARIPPGPEGSLIPAIKALRVKSSHFQPNLEVELAGNLPALATDIFVEGHSGAYFRKPVPGASAADVSTFNLAIDGLTEPGELSGKTLTLTLVSGAVSLEQTLTVE